MAQIRLQKFLSAAGVCSRRTAEVLISQNQVKVNGQIAKLGDKVEPGKDKVEVRGEIIAAAPEKIYLVLNKPVGYTTTRADHHAEKTIYDLLPTALKNQVWPAGRLDKSSCGLLLLTNDGELTQKLTHPSFEHEKEYLVRFIGQLTPAKLDQLRSGLKTQRITTLPCRIKVIKPGEIKIILREGQKRQVREMLSAVNCHIDFLQRIRENKLTLGDLPPGQYKTISRADII